MHGPRPEGQQRPQIGVESIFKALEGRAASFSQAAVARSTISSPIRYALYLRPCILYINSEGYPSEWYHAGFLHGQSIPFLRPSTTACSVTSFSFCSASSRCFACISCEYLQSRVDQQEPRRHFLSTPHWYGMGPRACLFAQLLRILEGAIDLALPPLLCAKDHVEVQREQCTIDAFWLHSIGQMHSATQCTESRL